MRVLLKISNYTRYDPPKQAPDSKKINQSAQNNNLKKIKELAQKKPKLNKQADEDESAKERREKKAKKAYKKLEKTIKGKPGEVAEHMLAPAGHMLNAASSVGSAMHSAVAAPYRVAKTVLRKKAAQESLYSYCDNPGPKWKAAHRSCKKW